MATDVQQVQGAIANESKWDDQGEGIELVEAFDALKADWKAIVAGFFVAGLVGAGVALLIPPTFTAQTLIMPPQQQSAAASALGSLGALAGLTGGAVGLRTPADQYVALMQSATVTDRLIDEFRLVEVYDEKFRVDAKKKLAQSSTISVGKKDGLIAISVEDRDPKRAAALANAYVGELRRLTSTLAVTEAQQRRTFFEQRLREAKDKLTQAQINLQASGFNADALNAEPKSAAEGYAKLRAEATAAEVKLQTMRRILSDNAPELLQQQALLTALRGELVRVEQRDSSGASSSRTGADYISKYREFKYYETLFDLFARQYEAARVDESREGALIQVVDVAKPPEKKSKPKRLMIAIGCALAGAFALSIRAVWRGRAGLRPAARSGIVV